MGGRSRRGRRNEGEPVGRRPILSVAVLVGLVNFGALSTIRPGIGATFFGAVVVVTMFAAHCFDPRLIWDSAKRSG